MDAYRPGQLVTVSTGGHNIDGIVFAMPTPAKIIVAVVDGQRGPAFRTVHPRDLAERADAGVNDPALHAVRSSMPWR